MALYNRLTARMRCPRCGTESQIEAQTYFGFRNLFDYAIGDEVKWVRGNVMPKNGGRPDGGHAEGEGYVECPACEKDFWVKIRIRADMIERIKPDPSRETYIPD